MKNPLNKALRTARIATAMLLSAFAMLAGGVAQAEVCGTTTYPLQGDEGVTYGSVTVSNDQQFLYVNYTLTHPGSAFTTLYAWAGNDIANVPYSAGFGGPWPPDFPYIAGEGGFPSSSGETSYTFAIPFADLMITDATGACGLSLKVVPFANVKLDLDGDGVFDRVVIAWGGSTLVKDMRLWWYADYTVCCDSGPPPVEQCSTAFGKGGWVFTTDSKSNPEGLPSLGLTRNRWGWADYLGAPGSYVYDLMAGAGLNYADRGSKVGTVVIDWDGAVATITYNVTAAGYYLKEAHAYAADVSPITVAPGQYGSTAYLGDALTHTFVVNVADSNGTPDLWAIAHAVVCR